MASAQSLIDSASALSPQVLAAIITSSLGTLAAIAGIIWNQWQTTKNQRAKIAADAASKTEERQMALRKEVYLPLAASLVEVQTYLATLHERTPAERTVMTEFAAASARLAMVADSDTALMAQQLSAEIAILSMELTIGALPAIHAKGMIKIHQDMKCAAEARAEFARVKMDEFLRSGVVDENVFNAIRRNIEGHDSAVATFALNEVGAQNELQKLTLIFAVDCLDRFKEIIPLAANVLIAIRKELGQETDASFFAQQMLTTNEKVTSAARAALLRLENSGE